MTLKIKPIVEGHGEVEAVPVLLRRISEECFSVFDVDILQPGRYPSSRLIKKQGDSWIPGTDLSKASGHARNQGAQALMIILDMDDDCAKQAAEAMAPVLPAVTGFDSVGLVFAVREYEGWFLASAETLRDGGKPYPKDPEAVRNAKKALEEHIGSIYYEERSDQPAFTAKIDLKTVYSKCRSFRKLIKEYRQLLMLSDKMPAQWP